MYTPFSRQKTVLVLKYIIRAIILEYSLDTPIYDTNSLHQYLSNIIWKAALNCNLYTHESANNLLTLLENKLTRGALFPNTFQNLLLELIELLDQISGFRNNQNTNNSFK